MSGRTVARATRAGVVLAATTGGLINELHGGRPWWIAAGGVTLAVAVQAGWVTSHTGKEQGSLALATGGVYAGQALAADGSSRPNLRGFGRWLGPGAVAAERDIAGTADTDTPGNDGVGASAEGCVVIGRSWLQAPGAVPAERDNTGTVFAGPGSLRVIDGRFDRLHDAIFDAVVLYEQLDLAHFYSRRELIARIDQQIAAQDRGHVVIHGEAGVGVGKSALAAHLVWTQPCVYHFTRLWAGARNPVEARKSLAAQLIGGWGLADRFARNDAFPGHGRGAPDWMAKVIRAAAADRAPARSAASPRWYWSSSRLPGQGRARPGGHGHHCVAGAAGTPNTLPSGVFIVVTTRYGAAPGGVAVSATRRLAPDRSEERGQLGRHARRPLLRGNRFHAGYRVVCPRSYSQGV